MSDKATQELIYLIWKSIAQSLNKAVKYKNLENIEMYQELVDFYCDNYTLYGSFLKDKMLKLKELQGDA